MSETQSKYSFTFDKVKDSWTCSVHGNVGEAAWVQCWNGCEDGYFDAHEDDPINNDEGDLETCRECRGEGGFPVCPQCNIDNPDAEF